MTRAPIVPRGEWEENTNDKNVQFAQQGFQIDSGTAQGFEKVFGTYTIQHGEKAAGQSIGREFGEVLSV